MKMGMYPRIPAPYAVAFAAHRQPWEGGLEGVVEGITEYCTQYLGPTLKSEGK
jgi:hypothetical protein